MYCGIDQILKTSETLLTNIEDNHTLNDFIIIYTDICVYRQSYRLFSLFPTDEIIW